MIKQVQLIHVETQKGYHEGFYAIYGNEQIELTRDQIIMLDKELGGRYVSMSEDEKWSCIKEITKKQL